MLPGAPCDCSPCDSKNFNKVLKITQKGSGPPVDSKKEQKSACLSWTTEIPPGNTGTRSRRHLGTMVPCATVNLEA